MLSGFLDDERGARSSKRLIGVTAAFAVILLYVLHTLTILVVALKTKTPPAPPDAVTSGIVAGLAGWVLSLSSADKRSPMAVATAEVHKARASQAVPAVDAP